MPNPPVPTTLAYLPFSDPTVDASTLIPVQTVPGGIPGQWQLATLPSLSAAAGIYNVMDPRFGAKGDGIHDDTAAVQAAIDAADDAGGGTVLIPARTTCLVMVAGARALTARPNVTLLGVDWTSVLKLADNQANTGSVWSIIAWNSTTNEDVGGFSIQNLTIDQNGPNNPAPTVTPTNPRYVLQIGNASAPIVLRRVNLINLACVNAVYVGGSVDSLFIEDSRFVVQPPVGASYWDSSLVYHHPTLSGSYNAGIKATGNVFLGGTPYTIGASQPGNPGAGCCIETHGGWQKIGNNVAVNMSTLANITGITVDNPSTEACSVTGNIGFGCRIGVTIYAQPYSGSTGPLKNVVVADNAFEIETDAWVGQTPGFIYARGILVNTTTIPVWGLTIANNVVRYRPFTSTGTSADSPGVGIYFSSTSSAPLHRNVKIVNNTVDSPQSSGIYVQGNHDGCHIVNNTVRNPSQVTAISNGFRVAILAQMDGAAALVAGNILYDDQATPTTVYFINTSGQSTTGHNLVNFEIRDNVMWQASDPTSTPVTPFFFDSAAGNSRSPLVMGQVHTWIAPAGKVNFDSRLTDGRLNRAYRQVTTPSGTTWTIQQTHTVSADRGDASKVLTIDDVVVQLWNTALTAARTVTFPTASTANGVRYRIVRGSGATGAFNLTVNTVKVLNAASQWCEFESDGASWVEIAAGSL